MDSTVHMEKGVPCEIAEISQQAAKNIFISQLNFLGLWAVRLGR